jgi:hypothetical protein
MLPALARADEMGSIKISDSNGGTITFDGDLKITGSNFTFTLTYDNSSGGAGALIPGFAVQLFTTGTTVTANPAVTGTANNWVATGNDWPLPNSQNGPFCTSVGSPTGSVCATGSDVLLTQGGTDTFTISGMFTGGTFLSGFDLMTQGFNETNGVQGKGKDFAISATVLYSNCPDCNNNQPPPPPISEPASLAMLGTTLVGLTGVVRRRMKK